MILDGNSHYKSLPRDDIIGFPGIFSRSLLVAFDALLETN